jgi:tetratricopeptide (TPR) repeat protein
LNTRLNLFLAILVCLLASTKSGLGQQQGDSSFAALVASAQQAQASHDYAAAADAYKQALRLRPNMAELWANLGLMEREAGDTPQAISSFEHASRLNPSLYVPNLFLGVDYARSGKAKEAIVYLLRAEKENNTDPEPRLALGRAYTSLGNYSLAADAYSQAVTINPKQSSTWFALGIARLDQVEADSRKLAAQDKDSSYAKGLFAESLDKQSRYAEAARIYQGAVDIKPQPPCLRAALGWSLLRQQRLSEAAAALKADTGPQCALSALGKARMAIDGGDEAEALRLLNDLWTTDHGFVKANIGSLFEGVSVDRALGLNSVLIQRRSTLPDELVDLLSASVKASPAEALIGAPADSQRDLSSATPGIAGSGTAEFYYESGQYQRCSDKLKSSAAATQATLLLQATCSYLTGDYEHSSQASAALARSSTHSSAALYWSIKANEKLAFQALARFEELEPDSARSHILLGDILRQRVEYTEALAEYKKAHEIDPADQAAMLGMASAYLGNNDLNKTIETARAALIQSPSDPELSIIMAEGLVAQHEYAEAEPYLMKGLNAKPQMLPHVHALFGNVYAEEGKTTEAIAQLKLGLASDEDGSVHYQLARLYRQTGDNQSASQALEQMKLIQKKEHQRELFNPEESRSQPADNGPH